VVGGLESKTQALVEGLLFLAVVVLAYYSYALTESRLADNTGVTCGPAVYHVGPGSVTLKYRAVGYQCNTTLTIPYTLNASETEEGCMSLQGLPALAFTKTGSPIPFGNLTLSRGYALTPMGVRPAYVVEANAFVRMCPMYPTSQPRVLALEKVYFDQYTGLPIRARASIVWGDGSETPLWDYSATTYTLRDGGKVYVPGLLVGIAYAGTSGVAGVALGLALKRLFEAAA
jgi:hypothetical protein